MGGHQASSASSVGLLTALYFHHLREGDVVALKAHAAPAFYAIQYLFGRLTADDLRELRTFGRLQAYPSRRKNPEVVDLSTGSMGLGAVQATFGAFATRYQADHGGPGRPERVLVMVGDAELDEGNVWEALLEEPVAALGNCPLDRGHESPEPGPRGAGLAAPPAPRHVRGGGLARAGAALGLPAARALRRPGGQGAGAAARGDVQRGVSRAAPAARRRRAQGPRHRVRRRARSGARAGSSRAARTRTCRRCWPTSAATISRR